MTVDTGILQLQQQRDAIVKRFRARSRKYVLELPMQLRRVKLNDFIRTYKCDVAAVPLMKPG